MALPNSQLRAVCGVMLLPQYRKLNSLATTVGDKRTPQLSNACRKRSAKAWVSVDVDMLLN
jgi:hypothetical protein